MSTTNEREATTGSPRAARERRPAFTERRWAARRTTAAVTAAVVRRAAHRRAVKATRRRRADRGLPVVASRTFVVDVHLLGSRD